MSTLKKIKRILKEKGVEEENIKMGLAIMMRLEVLDGMVFPENPATIKLVVKRHRFGFLAAHIYPNQKTNERYSIYLDGLASSLKEEKGVGSSFVVGDAGSHARYLKPTWEELLMSIAVHEVRHRFQYDYPLKKFSPKSANLTEEEPLKSIIKFNELSFRKKRKNYLGENRSKTFIKDRTNGEEFDARVIELLAVNIIHERKNSDNLLEEIASVIRLQAP